MLSLQAVERVQALLDRLQTAGLGLDPVQVGAQGARRIVQLDREGSDPLRDRVERRVNAVHRRQPGLGFSKRGAGPAQVVIGAGDRRQRLRRRRAQALGVAKALALGLELALLAGIGRGGLDLGELEAEQVEVPLPCSLALAQLGQLA